MVTRVRESGLRGKEKKGSQADNTMPQQHKRTTTTATTTTSRLMSSSSPSIASSVPNYLRPTTASSAVQVAGDKPSPARRKSLDRPLSHLDTHRNLTGDKPSPARRKSFDRPIQSLHSPLSSPSSSPFSTSSQPYKPTFSRTKSSLDRPKSSTAMSRTSEANDRRGKIMTRSISSVSKSSSIAHNHHLKTTPNKTQKNSTRKQPGNTTLSSKPINKKPTETILITNHHQEPSVPIPQSADHHKSEVSATPNPNQTETNNNSKIIVQEKENIIVVVSLDHEEFEDLKSIEDCSSLSSVLEDPVDTITEEGDAEEISVVPENLQESGQTQSADTMPPTTPEDPQVEDKVDGEINNTNNLKETTLADPKPADEISVEEKGDETMHDNNCNENKAENQEEGEEEERKKEKDKKADNQYHHQEVAEEEVKEMTYDQSSNNNNNNNNNNVVQQPETNKPALKRNESVVSNDVIEETASKLREQRKNKVKALAGAFETVISLQDK
ncbi:putative uncharacterized protein DDB_G0277255 [Ipomoea triloba]|uniref:putative uncharacterized protein DDB_G0277255 n=1 Tax=Ipomoea triloba TaxID=35885 RepID=UPI00125D32AA|nr:putative uncharacterized protein DDB_G0277255 [Ipomoea triloba]